MLELIDVKKVYNQGKTNEVVALDDISLTINEGEMVALMGPSGSGKSTLLNVIGGLTPVSSGKIFVEESDVTKLSEEELAALRRDRIGYIFQHFNLLEYLTAEQNVMLPLLIQGYSLNNASTKATTLLRELGLGGRVQHFPRELSGGQEQRVAISRSLITTPALILGDEPTGDLDLSSSEDVMKLFRRVNKENKQTLLLVTHSEFIGSLCDRVIRIDDGKIVENGELVK